MNMSTSWEKVLWKTQPYPDNHIPRHEFLSALQRNPNFTPYTYWQLVLLSGPVTQHLTTILLFISTFIRLEERSLDPRILMWISILSFLSGYLIWETLDRLAHKPYRGLDRFRTIKSSILIFLALMSLSPVLRTLTAATSSDSIWALSATLFIINTLLADYTAADMLGAVQERLTSVLSMNAAISSSVVLASRLENDLAVFALILFSVHVFSLFPILRRRLQVSPAIVQLLITLILSGLALMSIAPLSLPVTWICGFALCFVSFLAPGILVWAQKYKNEIRGPWDVAVPKVN